jgi:hypothetical protein
VRLVVKGRVAWALWSAYAKQADRRDRERSRRRHRAAVRAAVADHRSAGWLEWLRTSAARGDADALTALRSGGDQLECPNDQAPDPPGRAECESPTVSGLELGRRPKPLPICAACPHSLWFASAKHLRCFCRLMHVVTWNSEQPSSPIAACDGIMVSE